MIITAPQLRPLLALFILLMTCSSVTAQQLKGKVLDAGTSTPLPFVTVSTKSATVLTDDKGNFTLPLMSTADTVTFTYVGYKKHQQVAGKAGAAVLIVVLYPEAHMLNQVAINNKRNYVNDSLRFRRDYNAIFNYHAPTVKDAIVPKADLSYTPYGYNKTLKNATEIFGINVLALLQLTGKKRANLNKLKKTLYKQEEADYIDHIFTPEKVKAITALRGDTLQTFMDAYRPTAKQLHSMSNYDVLMYIKHSFAEFKKNGYSGYTSPF